MRSNSLARRIGRWTAPWLDAYYFPALLTDGRYVYRGHEAWNLSAEQRIVVIFGVSRPELAAPGHELIAATLSTVTVWAARPAVG